MHRGTTVKTDTPTGQTLLRPMVTRRYEFAVEHGTCCGCKTCATVCPKEAITLSEPEVVDGRLVTPARVDIDAKLCSFCGECVAVCPTHALSMTVNDESEIPVIKGQAFPMLIRTMRVSQAPLEAAARENGDVAYIDNCPVGAIHAEVERDEAGQVVGVRDVDVDRQACINCTHCMELGPEGGFTVTKPYKGRTFLNISLCPQGCQACADVCPSNAITYDGTRVDLDQRFCLFCGACEHVCPAVGPDGQKAVHILRTGFVHTPISSGAWAAAVEKLVSYQETVREYDVKGQQKRRKLALEAILGVQVEE
jgi:4Fe-4S ferredoxin